jgi:hypothetical protein
MPIKILEDKKDFIVAMSLSVKRFHRFAPDQKQTIDNVTFTDI